jgi:hypothetical protein
VVAVVIVSLTALGGEAKGVAFGKARARASDHRRRRSSGLAARPENRPHWSPGRGRNIRNSAPTIQNVELFAVDGPPAWVGCCLFFDGVPPAFGQEAGFK